MQSGPQSFAGHEHTVSDHLIPGVGSGGRPNLALELAKSNTRLMRLEADRARAYFEHTKADNTGALQSAFSGLAEAAEDAVEAMRLGRNSRELAEALRQVREKGGIG